MIRGIIPVFLVAIAVVPAGAEQTACLERTIPVSISSNDGSPAPELTAASLEGFYDKKPVVVRSVELEKTPPLVILLIDTSGSMWKRGPAAFDVAEGVLSKLPANIEVGLVFFAADRIPVVLPTLDRRVLTYQLEALRRDPRSYRGKTALWSAITDGAKIFKNSRSGDSLYLISDGGENRSIEHREHVEADLANAGIRLFAFLLTAGADARTPEELSGPIEVQRIVDSTGGTAIVTAEPGGTPFTARVVLVEKDGKPTQLGQSVSRQLDQIVRFYRIEMALPQLTNKPREWKLRLAAPATARFRLTYPSIIWPCF